MEWEKPVFVEVALACEVSGYANAQLNGEVQEGKPEASAAEE